MEQTAVEWYEKQIWSLQLKLEKKEISIGIYALKRVELFEQAKEMEKERIIKTYEVGIIRGANYDEDDFHKNTWRSGEKYYNETFKSEQDDNISR